MQMSEVRVGVGVGVVVCGVAGATHETHHEYLLCVFMSQRMHMSNLSTHADVSSGSVYGCVWVGECGCGCGRCEQWVRVWVRVRVWGWVWVWVGVWVGVGVGVGVGSLMQKSSVSAL